MGGKGSQPMTSFAGAMKKESQGMRGKMESGLLSFRKQSGQRIHLKKMEIARGGH